MFWGFDHENGYSSSIDICIKFVKFKNFIFVVLAIKSRNFPTVCRFPISGDWVLILSTKWVGRREFFRIKVPNRSSLETAVVQNVGH